MQAGARNWHPPISAAVQAACIEDLGEAGIFYSLRWRRLADGRRLRRDEAKGAVVVAKGVAFVRALDFRQAKAGVNAGLLPAALGGGEVRRDQHLQGSVKSEDGVLVLLARQQRFRARLAQREV